MFDIRHRVGVAASLHEVYESLTTIDGLKSWWTQDIVGDPPSAASSSSASGRPDRVAVMEVVSTDPTSNVTWRCVGGPDEWIDTTVTFDLRVRNPTRPCCSSPTPGGASPSSSWPTAPRSGGTTCSA